MNLNKIKVGVYCVTVLWLVAFAQIIVNEVFTNDEQIIEAFAITDTKIAESRLEVTAYYGDSFLEEQEKREMLYYLANGMGLTTDIEIVKTDNGGMRIVKESEDAKITITLTGMEDNKQYIHILLIINESPESILYYKERAEKIVEKLKITQFQSLIRLKSCYPGKLSEEGKNKATNCLLDYCKADIVSENRGEDIYTVYAYSDYIEDYMKIHGKKVNMNVAVQYDEEEDSTILYLATPILNEDY